MDRLNDLQTLLREFLHNEATIEATTTFAELNMDSYDVVDFLLEVEERYGIVIDDDDMSQMQIIQDVLDVLAKCIKEETL